MTDHETRRDPTEDPLAHPDEPGAYVGNRPERQAGEFVRVERLGAP